MTRKWANLALSASLGCALVCAAGHERLRPRVLFNTTASAPIGFYWLTPSRFERGDLVAVHPPSALARWMALRGYLPTNVPLLKIMVAVDGQEVCGRGRWVFVDGEVVAERRAHDRWGRALPAFAGCRRLSSGEVFLVNRQAPNSLDSRYFGPVPKRGVLGRARPLWTWAARP